VPAPVPPTEHGYKYSAVYGVDGVRVVGFDNERGKGDHCHIEGVEMPYPFKGVDQLIEDVIAAVAARRALATSLGNFPRSVGRLFALHKVKVNCRCESWRV
jgi:hypothetical protein